MKRRGRLAVVALATSVLLAHAEADAEAASAIDETKVVDLTHTFDATTVYWPTEKGFELDKVSDGVTPGGWYYAANKFKTPEHGGTHLDAPLHFAKDRFGADQVPLASLIGPAVVIDVTAAAEKDRDYLVTVADLEAWEKRNGRIPDGALVLMRSGWSKRWPDHAKVLGSAKPGDTQNLHFPGFSKEAATFLVEERTIDAVGVDTPSLDNGPSRDFIVHQIVNGANKPGLENLANLEALPESGATIVALPMKIGGGSGAPLRAIAILP
ncbi:MAG: cyclase family protein [Deltaproteobacteria bacterium]|nr:cyclase family protein [Deltaproteobacteria bacterium]